MGFPGSSCETSLTNRAPQFHTDSQGNTQDNLRIHRPRGNHTQRNYRTAILVIKGGPVENQIIGLWTQRFSTDRFDSW